MKLNELVSLRNSLQEALDLASLKEIVYQNYNKLITVANEADEYFCKHIQNVAEEHLTVYQNSLLDKDKVEEIILYKYPTNGVPPPADIKSAELKK